MTLAETLAEALDLHRADASDEAVEDRLVDILAELKRREVSEQRLQRLLDFDTDCDVRFRRKNGEYRVALYRFSTNERLGSGASEDIHTAFEKALDAVGAP